MKNPTNLGVSDNSSNWHLEQPRPGAQPRRYRIQLSLLGLRNLQAMGNNGVELSVASFWEYDDDEESRKVVDQGR